MDKSLSSFSVALCESSVILCAINKIRTDTEFHREDTEAHRVKIIFNVGNSEKRGIPNAKQKTILQNL
jgi:hypothetical protein